MYTQTTEYAPKKLFELFTEALVDPKNRLPQNYLLEDLHSTENLCYSITINENGDAVSGSVARIRSFYKGGARVLSRYYTSKKLSRSGMRYSKYHTKGMNTFACEQLDQQVDFAIQQGINKHFVSREYGNFLIMKNIHKGIQYHCKYKDWVLEPNEWQTAPCDTDDCWQHIIWRGGNPLHNVR
tara:strand:- start:708 stop:1256 length:549 start_codon:yes stop_codon:yes gene_type:complete